MSEPFYDREVPPGPFDDEDDQADGAALLDDVAGFLGRFVAFPSAAARVAVALWIAHAHAVDAFESTPRLALLSPEPGSGKTRTLEVAELLVPRSMHALGASAAAVFRSIAVERPTLLFDEVDSVFSRHGKDDSAEDLRGILNSGHRKGATVPRCVGPRHDVQRFPVYAAVALAGLGDLPDTLMSRSIIIRMRRRAPDERVEPFRHRIAAPTGRVLRDRLAVWAEKIADQVGTAWPVMPEGIEDRPADCWEPLLAIADAAGGDWPKRSRAACTELCKVADNRQASLGIKLLADLREIFGDDDGLSTATVLDRLRKLEESPWADLRGKPIDSRGLATRLRKYDIRSEKVWVTDRSLQGYKREALHDAWQRYLPRPKSRDGGDGTRPQPAEAEGPEGPEGSTSEPLFGLPDAGHLPDTSGRQMGNGSQDAAPDLDSSGPSASSGVAGRSRGGNWPEGTHGEVANE